MNRENQTRFFSETIPNDQLLNAATKRISKQEDKTEIARPNRKKQ